jgi:Flp pilus assembly protein TadG
MKAIEHPIESMPRGTILILTALLLIVFIGLAALAVDIGVIFTAQAQLETVADAAALAGAMELVALAPNLSDPAAQAQASAQAKDKAIEFGKYNYVLNRPAVINDNDVDVIIDSQTNTCSVKVTAIRDGDHVGLVPAFFSSLLGYPGFSISVWSKAMVNFNTNPYSYYLSN